MEDIDIDLKELWSRGVKKYVEYWKWGDKKDALGAVSGFFCVLGGFAFTFFVIANIFAFVPSFLASIGLILVFWTVCYNFVRYSITVCGEAATLEDHWGAIFAFSPMIFGLLVVATLIVVFLKEVVYKETGESK